MKKSFIVFLLLLLFVSNCMSQEILYIEPYLQNVTQNSIVVMWWTCDSEDNSKVEYGANFENSLSASNDYISPIGKYLHRAEISGLQPGTCYKYHVSSGSIVSKDYTFHTAVNKESNFSFAIVGDGRTDNDEITARHRKITELAFKEGVNFAILAGDAVETGEQKHWDRFWRNIVTESDISNPGVPFASNVPYYLVVGNHEIYNGGIQDNGEAKNGNLDTSMARFVAYVDNPPNGSKNPYWNKRYYSFTYGVATFIILDTNNTSNPEYDNNRYLDPGSTPDWEPDSEQYLWMIEELKKAEENSVFTFVVMHPSPYCRGTHGDPNQAQNGYKLRVFDSLFHQYNVSAVLTSHDHLVEHCLTGPEGFEVKMDKEDPNNLNYLIVGNSGQASRYAKKGWEDWMDIKGNDGPPYYTTYFYDWEGKDELCSFLYVDITKEDNDFWKASFKVIRNDGQIFDEFSLVRKEPQK